MNPMTSTERAFPVVDEALPRARSVEGIHRSATFHWVGNGFYVSTYFPSPELSAERMSPFVLMDYGPSRELAPSAAASAASAGTLTAASRLSLSPGRDRSRTATTPGTPT